MHRLPFSTPSAPTVTASHASRATASPAPKHAFGPPPVTRRSSPIQHAAAVLVLALGNTTAFAQDTPGAAPAAEPGTADHLPAVRVTASPEVTGRAGISGLGAGPAWQAPVQAQHYSALALQDAGVQRLADMVKLDASVSDAYNTTGYWDYLSIRGFTLDNAYNYRREGLPINAETRIALDNKAAVEVLKGTSGIQSGVSAPGGLVNLLVKRPEGRVRHAEFALNGGRSVMASVDVGERFGLDERFGLRVNAAAERLAPDIDNTDGHRRLLAVVTDWVLAPGSILEAEFEHSLHRQPSVPGFSLLGGRLPSARNTDPTVNLNDQPWTLPVAMQGNTGSIRWRQRWHADWHSTVSYGEQHLRSSDRAAFPFGCSTEGVYDRYCADGSFDLYDYRSEGERRRTRALQAQLDGRWHAGGTRHDVSLGLLRAVHATDLDNALFGARVGTGDIGGDFGPLPVDTQPPLSPQTDRQEHSTEITLRDAIEWSPDWRSWVGVRHSRIRRSSMATDGLSPAVRADADVTTPWIGVGYRWAPQSQVYASWGEGVELRTVPGLSYRNAGAVLPVMKSRQWEIGVKRQRGSARAWGLSYFRITRDVAEAVPVGDDGWPSANFLPDGQAVHQGLEAQWTEQIGAWHLHASALLLDAKRRGSAVVDGKRPVNVPSHTAKLGAAYRWGAMDGRLPVAVRLDVVHEGSRWADAANEVALPSWTRVDLGVKAVQHMGDKAITWRLGVFNLLDKRAWRESPTLTGHIYLFPLQQRTVTASAAIDF